MKNLTRWSIVFTITNNAGIQINRRRDSRKLTGPMLGASVYVWLIGLYKSEQSQSRKKLIRVSDCNTTAHKHFFLLPVIKTGNNFRYDIDEPIKNWFRKISAKLMAIPNSIARHYPLFDIELLSSPHTETYTEHVNNLRSCRTSRKSRSIPSRDLLLPCARCFWIIVGENYLK